MAVPATSLLFSKLRPPGISGGSLRRDALIEELIAGGKATLIAAPAGSGKTTLMEQTHQELRLRAVPTAWLTFDANDTDALSSCTIWAAPCGKPRSWMRAMRRRRITS